jgi:hypothetical protein
MSGSDLKVRCLASTRVSDQAWQEQNSKDGDELHDPGDSKNPEEYILSERYRPVSEPVNESTIRSSQDEFEEDRIPTPESTSHSTSGSDDDSDSSSDGISTIVSTSHDPGYTSCIQEAQLSPDGTCIFTSDYSRSFSVYPIDTNVQNQAGTCPLKPYAQFTSADPIWAFAANPLFDVTNAHSTHVLISRRDRYITLHNALWDISGSNESNPSGPANEPVNIAQPLASYKLINHLTEAVSAPLSLAYSHTGTHFFAGLQNSIAIFDLESSDDPIHKIPTIPSTRSKLKGGGRGFKGWISALTLSPPTTFSHGGVLAAGSRTRNVGIYDAISGEEITTFSLPGTLNGRKLCNENLRHVMGDGVSCLKYSPCGKYLYVAERQSDVLLIYDVRNFTLALGYCAGRAALTKQKLGFDVWNAGSSPYDVEGMAHEVWAGGTDGMVRVWRDPYRKEGAVEADEVVRIGEGDTSVVGTMVHVSGGLAVAACGRVEVGDAGLKGKERGGSGRPKFSEWGSLEILGLS